MAPLTVPEAKGASHGCKKSPFMQSHSKSTDDVASIFFWEFLEEDIFSKPCGLAIFFPLSS
jgi:hypothetical protein